MPFPRRVRRFAPDHARLYDDAVAQMLPLVVAYVELEASIIELHFYIE